jgi:hypothetical protein
MGKPIGVGKKVYPDGKVKDGFWDKGKFIEGRKLSIHLIHYHYRPS